MTKKNKNGKKKGFTLIEMIIVIAIIAILLMILVPTMNGFIKAAQKEKDSANARSIYVAAKAQQTAYTVGLVDSDGTKYTSPAAEDGTITSATLSSDFWGTDFPVDSEGNVCTAKLAAGVITATCGTSTYSDTGAGSVE